MPDNCNLLQQELLEIKNNLTLLQSQSDALVANGDPMSASQIKENLKQTKMKREAFIEQYKAAVINLFDKLFRIPYSHNHSTTKVEINDNGRVTYKGNFDNREFSDYLKYVPSLVWKITGNVYLRSIQQMSGVEVIDGWLNVNAENFEAVKLKEINGKTLIPSKGVDISVQGKASFPLLSRIQGKDDDMACNISADTLEVPLLEQLDCFTSIDTKINLSLPSLRASENITINAPAVDAPVWEVGDQILFGDTCEAVNLPVLETCGVFSSMKIKKINLNVKDIGSLTAEEATEIILNDATNITFLKAPLAEIVDMPRLTTIFGTLSTPRAKTYTCPVLKNIERSLDMAGYQGKFREAFPVLEAVGMKEPTSAATIRVNNIEQKNEIEALVSRGELQFSGQIIVV